LLLSPGRRGIAEGAGAAWCLAASAPILTGAASAVATGRQAGLEEAHFFTQCLACGMRTSRRRRLSGRRA